MNRTLIISSLLFFYTLTTQAQTLPTWFTNSFKKQKLEAEYRFEAFIKPAFLEADFDGDGNRDVAALVINKKTLKKGILVIHRNGNKAYVFGAGVKFGKPGFEDYDDLKWMHGWKVNKDKFVYETVFSNGDIEGSKKVRIHHPGISIWDWMDGAPNAGGTLCWDGNKYLWMHEGE